jgi:hypothetical protein
VRITSSKSWPHCFDFFSRFLSFVADFSIGLTRHGPLFFLFVLDDLTGFSGALVCGGAVVGRISASGDGLRGITLA